MDTSQYKGVWTALITPFTDDHQIDWDALKKLIEHQIAGSVTGILVIGTTGESPTLTPKECTELIERAKKIIDGRCLLMAGSGSNCTQTSIQKTIKAESAGADCLLIVNPYYNKPTQHGLYLHFKAIADATTLPVFLYNIKGRTGVNLETETLLQLANDCTNIIGVKEASGDLEQIKEVCEKRPEGFIVLSGDDGITYQVMKEYGADGVVSVASNIIPAKLTQMVNNLDSQLNDELQDFFDKMFVETNPIPVKYLASLMGYCQPNYRLPMCQPTDKTKETLKQLA
jgi:4-hydroxy-tetrahydrodipicolinate synthase